MTELAAIAVGTGTTLKIWTWFLVFRHAS
jgi:hypothetical protein